MAFEGGRAVDTKEPLVMALFRRWQNEGLTPEELCRDCPELLEALKACIARARGDLSGNPATQLTEGGAEAPGGDPFAGKLPVIAGFTLIQKIAEGGQGAVYEAVQEAPHRKVAIKVLLESPYASRSTRHRFEREIDLVATLRHPHIVAVYASGRTSDGHLYYVMDYVRGVPLNEYVRQEKLSLEKTLELFSLICEAVNHAHQKGVMHRDLKPANILVDAKGEPHILDFGLAKQLTDSQESIISVTGAVMGTLPYMSPEQAQGNPDLLDIRTDVYALGVILYELLTGTYPYPVIGAMADVLRHIATSSPRPPTQSWTVGTGVAASARRRIGRRCPIDDEVETITLKALSKERERRYQSAGELGRDVQHYLRHESIEAKRDSVVYLIKRTALRYRVASAVVLSFLLLLVASTVIFWILRVEAVRQRDAAAAAEAKAQGARRAAVTNLVDMYTAKGLTSSDNGAGPLWFAQAALTGVDDPDRRAANLIRANNDLEGQWLPAAAIEYPGDNPLTYGDQVIFHPEDSRYLATYSRYHKRNTNVMLWDLATEQPLRLPAGFAHPTAVAWVPGRRMLLGNDAGQIVLASVPEGAIVRQWNWAESVAVRSLAASADGQWMAAAAGKELLVWAGEGADAPQRAGHAADVVYVSFAPSGNLLVTATEYEGVASVFAAEKSAGQAPTLWPIVSAPHLYRDVGAYWTRPPLLVSGGRVLLTVDSLGARAKAGKFKWYDTGTGALLGETSDGNIWNMRDMVASADGRTVALALGMSELYDVPTRKAVQSHEGSFGPSFSAKSDLYAFDGTRGIEVHRLSGGRMGALAGPILNLHGQTAFSRDGKYLAVLGQGVATIWRVPRPTTSIRTLRFRGRSSWAAFSPDSRYVAPIGTMDGEPEVTAMQVMEVATGQPAAAEIPLHAALVSAAFSPDGNRMACLTGIKSDPRELRIWEWQTGTQVLPTLKLEAEPVWVAYSPDGGALAVHDKDGRVAMLEAATGRPLYTVQCGAVRKGGYPWIAGRGTIRFSRDGGSFFTWGTPVVEAWDRATGKRRFAVKHADDCWALAESPDGRLLATASYDGTLGFWDAGTGEQVHPPIRNPNDTLSVDFSPDGKLVCAACENQARVWDVATQELRYAIHPDVAGGGLSDMLFSRDGRFLATVCNSSLQLWDAPTGYALSRSFTIPRSWHIQLDISSDNRWLVAAGALQTFQVVDLAALTAARSADPQDLLVWGEILSNSRISGATTALLTNGEWLARWRQYRARHPEVGFSVAAP
jgi:serine/threonine protein kinase/WD40 repeat protein